MSTSQPAKSPETSTDKTNATPTSSPRKRTGGGYALDTSKSTTRKLHYDSPGKEKHHRNNKEGVQLSTVAGNRILERNQSQKEPLVAGPSLKTTDEADDKPAHLHPGHQISHGQHELLEAPSKDRVSFILNPSRDSDLMARGEMPYFLQGDEEMYTDEAVQQRKRLHENPVIRLEIRNIAKKLNWADDPETADQSIELKNSVLDDPYQRDTPAPTPFPGVGKVLPYEEYKRMYRCFLRVLRPEAAKNDLVRHLEMDWHRDSTRESLELDKPTKRRPVNTAPATTHRQYEPEYIHWRKFYYSVFELIDQWCQTTKLVDYRSLLKALQETLPDIHNEINDENEPGTSNSSQLEDT